MLKRTRTRGFSIKTGRKCLVLGLLSAVTAVGTLAASLPHMMTAYASAPTVLSVTPSGTGVPLSGNIVITFSEDSNSYPMNGVVQLNALAPLTGGSFDASGTIYTIPYSGLAFDTNYTINISGFQDDATGTTMTPDSSHSFITNIAAITISVEPQPTTNVTEGSISGSLSVTASADSPATLNYQWYSNTILSNFYGGSVISGETGSSFTIPTTLTVGTYYYYCILTATGNGASNTLPTAVATVNVIAATPLYIVTLSSEGTGATGSGSYAAGAIVNLDAGTPLAGRQFVGWTSSPARVTFADSTSAITSFTMPAGAVTITAVFEDIIGPPATGPGTGIGVPSTGANSTAAEYPTWMLPSAIGTMVATVALAFFVRKRISQLL